VASKNHNPGCPCCNPCKCYVTLEPTRKFTGTPTVKVVIAGVPDTISPILVWPNFGTLREYIPTGLSAVNGTYFFAVPKQENGCIVNFTSSGLTPDPFELAEIEYDRELNTTVYDSCSVVSTSSATAKLKAEIRLSKHVSSFGIADAGDISVFFSAGEGSAGGSFWGLSAGLLLQCTKEYDYYNVAASKLNSVLIFPGFTETWPVPSGDVKLIVGDRDFTRCGIGPLAYRFENAGTITAELLDI